MGWILILSLQKETNQNQYPQKPSSLDNLFPVPPRSSIHFLSALIVFNGYLPESLNPQYSPVTKVWWGVASRNITYLWSVFKVAAKFCPLGRIQIHCCIKVTVEPEASRWLSRSWEVNLLLGFRSMHEWRMYFCVCRRNVSVKSKWRLYLLWFPQIQPHYPSKCLKVKST